jgi:hypothetical protein
MPPPLVFKIFHKHLLLLKHLTEIIRYVIVSMPLAVDLTKTLCLSGEGPAAGKASTREQPPHVEEPPMNKGLMKA